MVDMDAVINAIQAKDNDSSITRQTVQQVGMTISALEHRIPELFFTNEEHPGEAVSAVKALAVASAQGQRIYQVTKENVNAVLPALNISAEVKDEIRDSVAVGKEATVSQSNITVASWTGVGYIISDPETGAGAYRISGGGNGGSLTEPEPSVILLIFSSLVFSIMLSLSASAMANEVDDITKKTKNDQEFQQCIVDNASQRDGVYNPVLMFQR